MLLPLESELVAGINVHKLVGSTLWQRWIAPRPVIAKAIRELRDACGYEPLEVLTSIAFGMKGLGTADVTGVLVMRGMPRDKTMACVPALDKSVVKSGGTVTRDGDAVLITDKDGKTGAYAFIDETTVVTVMGPGASKASIDAVARRRNGLPSSPAFMDMFRKVHASDAVWLLLNGNSSVLSKFGSVGIRPKGVFGSIDVTDRIVLAIALRLGSADEANATAKMLQGQVNNPQVQQMFDKLEITADQNDVDVALELGDTKLQQLMAMIGGMMGP